MKQIKANAKSVFLLQQLAQWYITYLLDVSRISLRTCFSVKSTAPLFVKSMPTELQLRPRGGLSRSVWGDKFCEAVKFLNSRQ